MNPKELERVYSVKDAMQAEIIKGALHAEGIACEIEGEGQAGLTGIFDIDIFVKAEDADRARAIIDSHTSDEQQD